MCSAHQLHILSIPARSRPLPKPRRRDDSLLWIGRRQGGFSALVSGRALGWDLPLSAGYGFERDWSGLGWRLFCGIRRLAGSPVSARQQRVGSGLSPLAAQAGCVGGPSARRARQRILIGAQAARECSLKPSGFSLRRRVTSSHRQLCKEGFEGSRRGCRESSSSTA